MDTTVALIGGGIGGLTAANALQQVGIDYRLYERAPALTEVGAGIGLSAGAMRILGALGLGEAAHAASVDIGSMCFADKSLRVRRWMPETYTGRCIHRADLIGLLRSRLPESAVSLGRTAVSAESHADHAEVVFEDGSRETASVVIAADGIGSAIRRSVFPGVGVRPIDQAIWRGISPRASLDGLEASYVEIWDDGLRFLTVPLGASHTFWLAVQPAPPGGVDDPATLTEDLCTLFADFSPALRRLIREAEGPILRNDMADLGLPRSGWHQRRVVFIGDAIHATTPNLAQGGCQAMESALCLAMCLDTHAGDPQAAFETYHRLRKEKVGFVVRTSWSFGRAAHTSNPLVHYGYRALLEHAPAWVLNRQAQLINDLTYLRDIDQRRLLAD